ncbi:hypothetical protein [Akkermansia glycaniphila]|uniref:hypothetical protein n=1 Tax=Akkermansia glycaniphila TaxID=1679444 RepID=UPI001C038DEF|nr:hypothetical protein [Akkermansia glycaniphila]
MNITQIIAICICSSSCTLYGEVEQELSYQNELESKICISYFPMLIRGTYHDDKNKGACLEINMLNGNPKNNLRLPLAIPCPDLHDRDKVCGIIYGHKISKDGLGKSEISNFLPKFLYVKHVSEKQWEETLCLYYDNQSIVELQRLVALMDLMVKNNLKEEISRTFMLSFTNYLQIKTIKPSLPLQDFRAYQKKYSGLMDMLHLWEDLFLERYETLHKDPLWKKIEEGEIHIEP